IPLDLVFELFTSTQQQSTGGEASESKSQNNCLMESISRNTAATHKRSRSYSSSTSSSSSSSSSSFLPTERKVLSASDCIASADAVDQETETLLALLSQSAGDSLMDTARQTSDTPPTITAAAVDASESY